MPNDNTNVQAQLKTLRRLCLAVLAVYLAAMLVLPLLMGDQLYYRRSRADLAMPEATSGTGELLAGGSVEQVFSAKIQRLQKITVLWASFNRKNAGTVRVALLRADNGKLLASQELNAADLTNGSVSVLEMPDGKPLEGLAGIPLLLRLSSDGVSGSAVSPMMSSSVSVTDGKLTVNGQAAAGTLCFTAEGEDYIWLGLHYRLFAALGALALLLLFALQFRRVKAGRKCSVLYVLYAAKKYRFLIRQLVSRDFKAKYKRSVLGVFWSFLNPLLTTLVQYLVFSNLFRFDIKNYPAYLLSGVILFNFFSECCGMSLTSIVGNAPLIKKVYVPKYIYPVTRALSSLINLLIALLPLFLVLAFSDVRLTKAALLLPFPLLCLAVFTLGVGMLLAAAMVFFRDTQFLWNVLIMIWMYVTPIFYPASILPDRIAWVLKCNPLYYFVSFVRTLLLEGVSRAADVPADSRLGRRRASARQLGIQKNAGQICPLPLKEYRMEQDMIRLDGISMRFRLNDDRVASLKEFFIKKLMGKMTYTDFWALKDVSFTVKKGEVLGIIGRNGAGKSTLLKVISGILKPTSGTVRCEGNIVPMLELGSGFDMDLTGRENIFLNGAILGYSEAFLREKYPEIVDFSELGQFIDVPIRNYSSGMLMRLAFSIATVVSPEVLIVDEILAVGDASFQEKSRARMKELMSGGTTVLFVSHSLEQICEMCSRVVWLEQGSVKMIGGAEEVCSRYRL